MERRLDYIYKILTINFAAQLKLTLKLLYALSRTD